MLIPVAVWVALVFDGVEVWVVGRGVGLIVSTATEAWVVFIVRATTVGVEGAVGGCMCAVALCFVECTDVSKLAGILIAVFSFVEFPAGAVRVGDAVSRNCIASAREYEVFGEETLIMLRPDGIRGVDCVVSLEECNFVIDHSVPWVL